ncbi:TPM domain-containing protein [Phenylobacterium sp.]|uniref:TPM domain-containing protein n=1 Tax=Phenylobacterium sp. TaxID=1871053 RepID=UPI0025DEBD31|nr:TPM domain-containing protein [Phenylobacterium sp.]
MSLVLLAPALALAAPRFPPLTGRVVDDAQILSPQAEAKLTAELAALEQKTGHQLVVATLPDLQGYEIEDYGYQLLRTWGIGRKGEDDGAIFIVAPSQRKVRIEVGYGLEPVLTDAMSSLILSRAVLPAFKSGDLEKGVVDGTEAIVAQLGLPPAEAQAQVAAAEAAQQRATASDGGGEGFPWIILVVFIVFWVLSGVTRVFGARRRFGGSGLWWLLPLILSNSGRRGGWSSGGGGGWGGGGGGGGGFSGGGGSGGGGGASGSW